MQLVNEKWEDMSIRLSKSLNSLCPTSTKKGEIVLALNECDFRDMCFKIWEVSAKEIEYYVYEDTRISEVPFELFKEFILDKDTHIIPGNED